MTGVMAVTRPWLNCETTDKSRKLLSSDCYNGQYSEVYGHRLNTLRKHFSTSSSENSSFVERIINVTEGMMCTVVGTLVKETPLRSSEKEGSNWWSENDTAVLEDDSGRLELLFDDDKLQPPPLQTITTGMVLGMTGVVNSGGVMNVQILHYPSIPAAPAPVASTEEESFTVLLSGLEFGNDSDETSRLAREMILDYLAGYVSMDDDSHCTKIARVMIVGNSCSGSITCSDGLKEFNIWLGQICQGMGIPVDILPGKSDPTNANWPQRPLHPSLLPRLSNLSCHCNPTTLLINQSTHIVATDGENIQDMLRFVPPKTTELQAMEYSLQCGHVCPTAPDSLSMEPGMNDSSYFFTQHLPHIYIAGNCSIFATKTVQNTRLICVPSFQQTHQIVLLSSQHPHSCQTLTFRPPS